MSEATDKETPRRRASRDRGQAGQLDREGAGEVTEGHKSSQSRQLSPQQVTAIEMIIVGKTDVEIAASVGVARETINRWRHLNPLFIAEVNQRRQDVWQATRERMRHLGTRALDVLDQHLQTGNLKAALAVLKYASEEKAPSGSTRLPDVIDDIADNLHLTALVRDLRTNGDHPFARGLRREFLGEEEPSDSSPH